MASKKRDLQRRINALIQAYGKGTATSKGAKAPALQISNDTESKRRKA